MAQAFETFFDIPYGPDSAQRQALDLYLPPGSNEASPLLVFVHGGGWRTEAKEDFRNDLMPAFVKATGLPTACVEYRLAPQYRHPTQALDSFAGLKRLVSSEPFACEQKTGPRWNRDELIIAGHSVGAFICLSLTLKPSSSDHPFSKLPLDVRDAVQGVVAIDGIYDLPSLLEEYPSYDSFVGSAFDLTPDVLERESPARWELDDDRTNDSPLHVLVLHSREDELLTLRQPEEFVKRFTSLQGVKKGKATLEVDYDTLKGTHDGVLRTDLLPRRVAEWAERVLI
ncbi:hypothetical protein OIO90_006571 [Microbotryomycetes sp. JL221]|nr:hypothetical protein OIO90_006571 [Microbotryomycetes sp. JL221]